MSRSRALWLVVVVTAALGVSTAGASLTFGPADPATTASETRDASHVSVREITHFHDAWDAIWKRGDGKRQRALDVNTLDEVPDSSWFENRVGTRPMSPAEMAAGPNRQGSPAGPWTVTSGKFEGVTPGLQMKDTSGQLYFVKFDPPGFPELGSGAEIISTKLLYALGYYVPENYIVIFARDDLHIAPGAMTRGADGKKQPMTDQDLDGLLANAARRSDGRYRAMASKALPGTPVGPFSYYGVRPDDPNDTIPHEHRRELRGLRVFAAWINHVDVKSENSLDTLVPTDDGHVVVRHNLLDFNATLGSGGIGPADRWSGYEYIVDRRSILRALFTFGLYVPSWLTIRYPDIPSVGRFEGERFDPNGWKPTFPNRAMLNARPDDTFWAARRAAAIPDAAIRAVVETADYSDPRATDAITKALIERRDKIAQEWLTDVNPLVEFVIDDSTLMFRNAAVAAGVSSPAAEYRVRWFRFDNAAGSIEPVGGPATSERPAFSVPANLAAAAEFIGAEVAAIDGQHASWRRPVRVYLRRRDRDWTLVGVERLPE
jgi:hypothetical protein